MPIIRRYIVGEASTGMTLIAVPDNGTVVYHPIAAAIMPTLGVICLTNDQPVNYNINQLAALPMNAGGIILIMGCALAQVTPPQNVEYNNPALTGGSNVTLGVPVLGGT